MSQQPMDYTTRYQILAGRTVFANFVKRRQKIEEGKLIGLNIFQPDHDASVVPFLQEGANNTTPEELALYLGTSTQGSGGGGGGGGATVPNPPTGVSAVAGDGEATVSFSAPSNDGGDPILQYTVVSSPDGIEVTGSSSPIVVTGLTNGTAYTFRVIATNTIGDSAQSSASSAVSPTGSSTVPDPPTSVSATAGNTQATITFTAPSNTGGEPITSYTVTSSPGSFTATGSSSPLTVTGLTNGTAYTFTVVATNSVGDSDPSSASSAVTPTVPPANTPLAPVLTAITFKTTDSMTLTFTQTANGTPAITNYKYSLNGGAFTAFSPVDTTSPVTIPGLSANTSYTITLKATNSNGDSDESNSLTETTYTTVNYDTFTTVGTTSWTAPADVTFVQYLVVGGGGGGGSTYSKINVLGNIQVTSNAVAGQYWINNGAELAGSRYRGRMYYGFNIANNSASFTDPIRLTASQTFKPFTYDYNAWYNTEIVYLLTSALVQTTNWVPPYIVSSTYANNSSGGSGGGAGGQVKSLTGTSKYTVTPGTTYTVVVGGGGAGGVGATNTEAVGSKGGDSSFDTITSTGGSGGAASRTAAQSTNGFGKGGNGGQNNGNLVGGSGGGQNFANNYGLYNSGGAGASGSAVNFDGAGFVFYGAGGAGGAPNTVVSETTVANRGKGGSGTGATLNSYASGIDGGSGIVILKYYT